jgi:mRNA interferase RelE/StbE
MTYSIKYHPAVSEDLQLLGEAVRRQVFKKLQQLARSPQLGQSLGNQAGLDLTGYRKAYVDNRRVRIVYRISEAEISILVIAVGKREDFEVYKMAYKRLMK